MLDPLKWLENYVSWLKLCFPGLNKHGIPRKVNIIKALGKQAITRGNCSTMSLSRNFKTNEAFWRARQYTTQTNKPGDVSNTSGILSL